MSRLVKTTGLRRAWVRYGISALMAALLLAVVLVGMVWSTSGTRGFEGWIVDRFDDIRLIVLPPSAESGSSDG